MPDLIIDEQFKELLPALDAESFASLERNVLLYGVRDPIVVWNGIVIDGHNRYAVCMKHDLLFHTVKMEFSTREEVLIWIIWNQILRRNLSSILSGEVKISIAIIYEGAYVDTVAGGKYNV